MYNFFLIQRGFTLTSGSHLHWAETTLIQSGCEIIWHYALAPIRLVYFEDSLNTVCTFEVTTESLGCLSMTLLLDRPWIKPIFIHPVPWDCQNLWITSQPATFKLTTVLRRKLAPNVRLSLWVSSPRRGLVRI